MFLPPEWLSLSLFLLLLQLMQSTDASLPCTDFLFAHTSSLLSFSLSNSWLLIQTSLTDESWDKQKCQVKNHLSILKTRWQGGRERRFMKQVKRPRRKMLFLSFGLSDLSQLKILSKKCLIPPSNNTSETTPHLFDKTPLTLLTLMPHSLSLFLLSKMCLLNKNRIAYN